MKLIKAIPRDTISSIIRYVGKHRRSISLSSAVKASTKSSNGGVFLLRMPQLSPNMKTGVIKKWIANKGDLLAPYSLAFEVSTKLLTLNDYATSHMEVEVVEGDLYMARQLVSENVEVAVNTPIALLCENQIDIPYLLELDPDEIEKLGFTQPLWQAYVKSKDDPGSAGCS